nr:immunoglobulin heavy chain junction region [Mus musculus]
CARSRALLNYFDYW